MTQKFHSNLSLIFLSESTIETHWFTRLDLGVIICSVMGCFSGVSSTYGLCDVCVWGRACGVYVVCSWCVHVVYNLCVICVCVCVVRI